LKILTILGTRPEIIRLSRIIPKLDANCDHVLVHTGQNFSDSLSDQFFRELGLRQPNHMLGIRSDTAAGQIGQIISRCDGVIEAEKPDRILLLGDTNSALSAIPAKRRGIPIFHMEAGNRCYDDRVPEEVNRRIIDHSSDILLPYTEHSRRNLLAEGIASKRVYVTGNPIKEVLDHYVERISVSGVLGNLALQSGRYILVTLHRAENVDNADRLRIFVAALEAVGEAAGLPVVVSTHPRTRSKMTEFGLAETGAVKFMEPFGFFDFVALEKQAFCVLSDSGTVQEECCILGIPTITLRDTTERPETLECGSNLLSGCNLARIVDGVGMVTKLQMHWTPPADYMKTDVSDTVLRILMTHF
jgi:UDP-N-acetylglucosamine 2-epimerase (non-hydrolysing)